MNVVRTHITYALFAIAFFNVIAYTSCSCTDCETNAYSDYSHYTALADSFFYKDEVDSALELHKRALSVASTDEEEVRANLNIASMHYYLGHIKETENIVGNCLKQIHNVKQGLTPEMQKHKLTALVLLSEVYNETGRYSDALRQNMRAAQLAKHLGDIETEVACLLYVSQREELNGNYVSAIDGYLEALAICEKNNLSSEAFNIYNHLQSAYWKIGEVKQSQHYINLMRKSGETRTPLQRCITALAELKLSIIMGEENDQHLNADVLKYLENESEINAFKSLNINGALTDYYVSVNDYEQAQKYLARLEEGPKVDSTQSIFVQMIGADVAMMVNKNAEAKRALLSVDVEQLRSLDISLYEKYLQLLSKCSHRMGDEHSAYIYNARLIDLRDSLQTESSSHSLAYRSMIQNRDTTVLSQKLRMAKQQSMLNEITLRREIFAYAAMLFTFAAIIVTLWLYWQRSRGKKKIIEEQNEQLRCEVAMYKQLLELQQKELMRKSNLYAREHNYAAYLQRKNLSLESELNCSCITEHFVLFHPCSGSVGGDFYWFHRSGDNLFVCCGDATGHGVPGAFIAMISYCCLNDIVHAVPDITPLELVNRFDKNLHNTLHSNNTFKCADSVDLAMLCININTHRVSVVLARQLAYIVSENGDVVDIVGTQRSLGDPEEKFIDRQFFEQEITLRPTDTIYLTTDGLASQIGGAKQRTFKRKNVRKTLSEIRTKPLSLQKNLIIDAVRDWRGDIPQTDDILVIGLKIDTTRV